MSDLMLHGVLNMPVELWTDGVIDQVQRHGRYVEASERIANQELDIEMYKKMFDDACDERDELVKRNNELEKTIISVENINTVIRNTEIAKKSGRKQSY